MTLSDVVDQSSWSGMCNFGCSGLVRQLSVDVARPRVGEDEILDAFKRRIKYLIRKLARHNAPRARRARCSMIRVQTRRPA